MGYIPGFSGAAFGAGLQRDRGITNRDLERKQKQLQKYPFSVSEEKVLKS